MNITTIYLCCKWTHGSCNHPIDPILKPIVINRYNDGQNLKRNQATMMQKHLENT